MKPIYILCRHFPTIDDDAGLFSDPDEESDLLAADVDRLNYITDCLGGVRRDRRIPLVAHWSASLRSAATGETLLNSSGVSADVRRSDPRLNNIKRPTWSGLTHSDVEQTELYRQWHDDPESARFPGGESFADLRSRVTSFHHDLDPGSDHLVVGHSNSLQVLMCLLLKVPATAMWSFYFDHYALTLVVDGVLFGFNWSSASSVDPSGLQE